VFFSPVFSVIFNRTNGEFSLFLVHSFKQRNETKKCHFWAFFTIDETKKCHFVFAFLRRNERQMTAIRVDRNFNDSIPG